MTKNPKLDSILDEANRLFLKANYEKQLIIMIKSYMKIQIILVLLTTRDMH